MKLVLKIVWRIEEWKKLTSHHITLKLKDLFYIPPQPQIPVLFYLNHWSPKFSALTFTGPSEITAWGFTMFFSKFHSTESYVLQSTTKLFDSAQVRGLEVLTSKGFLKHFPPVMYFWHLNQTRADNVHAERVPLLKQCSWAKQRPRPDPRLIQIAKSLS